MPKPRDKYRGQTVEGLRWRRVARVTLHDPYGGPATAVFDEEEMTEVDGAVSSRPVESLSLTIRNETPVPLVDPETQQPLGTTITQGEIYVALYSLYIALAKERDAR